MKGIVVRFAFETELKYNAITDVTLKNGINHKKEILRGSMHYGDILAKHLIPQKYKIRYNAKNLFRVELPGFWRMIYTLLNINEETICLIVDILSHEEYNKLFGYRRR